MQIMGHALAASEAAPMVTTIGLRIALPFKTGAKTEAVTVIIARGACEDSYSVSDFWNRLV